MSITNEILRIQGAKSDIKDAIERKGVSVSSSLLIDDYADLIDSIPYEPRLVIKFNVTSTSEPTPIMDSYQTPSDLFSAIEIDGVELETMTTSYTFTTTGEHTVKYTLIDPTCIEDYSFDSCSNVVSVTIPNTVTIIGEGAFGGCTGLSGHLDIPNTVTSIGSNVFSGCTGINSVVIPSGVTSISDSVFKGCSSLKEVVMQHGITSIGTNAFEDCSSLLSIFIPTTVTTIGRNAFNSCTNLTGNITIPESVTLIEDYAFNNCPLKSVTCVSTTPPTLVKQGGLVSESVHVFGLAGNDSTTPPPVKPTYPIYVPSESLSAYQTGAYWSIYNQEGRIQANPNS